MNSNKITVLGAGSWGTALSLLLHEKGHKVNLWMKDEDQFQNICSTRENPKYLPGIAIPNNLKLFTDIEEAVTGSELIVLTIPSQAIRGVIQNTKKFLSSNQVIINAAKGLEQNSLMRISEVVKEELPQNPFAALSGPSHAEEVCKNMPTTLAVASEKRDIAELVQDVFITKSFRVYTNPDLIGVELGGALKNVIAFGAGISDGLGFGDNAKAALMTRGIREIARLGSQMGANLATFAGLTGIGDLIVTCTSMHSRNRRAGILIGEGNTIEETLKKIGMVVEGVSTTKAAYKLSIKHGIEMPITKEIYKVIYEGSNAREAVTNLMSRDRTHEMEEIVEDANLNW
ncbi:NAD(P)H-dependent glycerol-3-phosphate dehydrogenase [Alkaliphilus peptidifermentans]|uniref:Glycerol-3-phosphate dehydrogenase [NAD(P)+] n=1 Tax=Alkaliphilus peptidifermentans DSM 18978 TaxID=1120976 RepID=A0A1G5BBD5_9FIRM|nr:NAD(P)H-dependent glycerol-3-phosphate dehydrogenase [Alkaliphilus peptidifermentans]SCX87465.1 glycerol 3-phosphate dehydrogenase (NAD(P)+) [Alkaliphilus peptidifermentans DSM 18978]